MKCHFCGDSVGISAAIAGDQDFCSRDHRTRYVARLRRGMATVACDDAQQLELAAPIMAYAPMNAPARIAGDLTFGHMLRLVPAGLSIAAEELAPQVESEPVVAAEPAFPEQLPFKVKLPRTPRETPEAGSNRLDKLAALAARMRGLRDELQGATDVPRYLATA